MKCSKCKREGELIPTWNSGNLCHKCSQEITYRDTPKMYKIEVFIEEPGKPRKSTGKIAGITRPDAIGLYGVSAVRRGFNIFRIDDNGNCHYEKEDGSRIIYEEVR